jgi:SLOG cluster3 family
VSEDTGASFIKPTVFLSASIPDPDRWDGPYDAFEITDAVTAVGRSVLAQGGRLVTAAHPTIAPLLLYLSAEFDHYSGTEPAVIVYQSRLFRSVLPEVVVRFEEDGSGRLEWTDAVAGEEPVPGRSSASLELMRRAMFTATKPDCAIFVGGMEGGPRFAFGFPGGAARQIAETDMSDLGRQLSNGAVYGALMRRILDSLLLRNGDGG